MYVILTQQNKKLLTKHNVKYRKDQNLKPNNLLANCKIKYTKMLLKTIVKSKFSTENSKNLAWQMYYHRKMKQPKHKPRSTDPSTSEY